MENKRIDFNLIIGFLLIGLLLYLMNNSLMNESDDESKKNNIELKEEKVADNYNDLEEEEKSIKLDKPEIKYSKEEQITTNDLSVLDDFIEFENNLDTLSNDNLELIFSNYCGCFIQARLIEKDSDGMYKYEYYKNDPVQLINESKDSAPLQFYDYNQFDLKESSGLNNQIIYEHQSGLQLIYKLDDANKLNLTVNNLDKDQLSINWNVKGPRQEKNLNSGWTSERTQSYLYYAYSDGDYDYISESDDSESEEGVSWIAYKQQFFSTILFSKNNSFFCTKNEC